MLQAARGETSPHTALPAPDLTTLTTWVVSCNAAPSETRFHPIGWGSPLDPANFHGAALRAAAYRTFDCQKCHGDDLRGGKAGVDCHSCHRDGPFACNTCHGDQSSAAPGKSLGGLYSRSALGVGAHRAHVTDNALHKALSCSACHPAITNAEDEGHYRFGAQFITDQPVVVLPAWPKSTQPAVWNRATATCTNVACHTPNDHDTAATKPTPVWTSVSGEEARCGACHGLGPTGHQNTHCEGCHTAGYADGGVDLGVHINGVVDFGPANRCDVCHAPPSTTDFYDTHGQHDAGVQTVGAHTAHLVAGTLRTPLTCGDCHLVPDSALSKHHVDSPAPAEVFSPEWLGGLAKFDGTSPTYSPATASCGSVYCHGAGATLSAVDQTPNLNRAPVWTGGSAQVACGTSCHGTPPRDGKLGHTIATSVQTCVQCHKLTVLPDGGIRFYALPDGGSATFHMNGVINGNN